MIELERPRDFSEILKTSLSLYSGNFAMLAAIAAAVVVPVHLIVHGFGLEQLWAPYDESPPISELVLTSLVSGLVTTPLVSAMTVIAMMDLRDGREPSARSAIQRGLELFTPIFLALLLVFAGVSVGLLLLVVPGIYLAIRWYFVTPSVVVEGVRGVEALRRSSDLVQDNWWRVFGIIVGTTLVAMLPAGAVGIPFGIGAELSDLELPVLIGGIVSETLIGPFSALVLTLLFFDLRSRPRVSQ